MLISPSISSIKDADDVYIGTRAGLPAANAGKTIAICTDTGEMLQSNGTTWTVVSGSRNANISVTNSANIGLTGKAFTKIIGNTVVSDPGSNYNSSTGIYTVPYTGLYQIVTKMRVSDDAPFGVKATAQALSFGQGVHTSEIDGAWFQWFMTPTGTSSDVNRNGSSNTRIDFFNAGDLLRMYYYFDLGSPPGSLAILKIAFSIVYLSR